MEVHRALCYVGGSFITCAKRLHKFNFSSLALYPTRVHWRAWLLIH